MFIHIVGAIGKSPSQTKLFGQPLYNTNRQIDKLDWFKTTVFAYISVAEAKV